MSKHLLKKVIFRDARIPLFNIRVLSVSVENYPYPYPIRSDVVNCYPYPIRIHGSIMVQLHRESKKFASRDVTFFDSQCMSTCIVLNTLYSPQILGAPETVLTICCLQLEHAIPFWGGSPVKGNEFYTTADFWPPQYCTCTVSCFCLLLSYLHLYARNIIESLCWL